tara:strand:- start:4822 stop:5343 length:522 start_codon:yes stop_codon:yes gene_type:complete
MIDVIKYNLKKDFKTKKDKMVDHCLNYKDRIFEGMGYNYEIDLNNDFVNLYQLFLKKCKDTFKKISFIDPTPRCLCCLIDKDTYENSWHDHLDTCTVNGVFYLKLADTERGIAFNLNERNKIIPDEFDLLIMKNSLKHKPLLPKRKNDCRISINMSVFCKEDANSIFDESNRI